MAILYGIGRPIVTVNIGTGANIQKVLLPIEPMSFKLTPAVNVVKSKKFNVDGQLVIAGAAKQSIEWSVSLGIEAITWAVLQMALSEVDQTSTNLGIGALRFANMPTTGTTFVINDTDVTSTPGTLQVAVYGDIRPRFLTAVAVGPPGPGQFTAATGVITLGDTNLNGRTIGYRVLLTVPTCQSIGVETAALQLLDNLSFEGILKTDSPRSVTKIYIPNLKSAGEPTVDVQSVTRFELVYDLPTIAGKSRPFELYDIPV